MSTSDPFLPVDPESDSDTSADRAHHESEDGQGPDVLPPDGEDASLDADEPPVAETSFFRTPSGESADPSKD